jgi:Kef-type K+ transport system membrane component KefB
VTARIGALILIAATMLGVQAVGPPVAASTVALPLGFALIAAYLLGLGSERVGLPRLSGYLFFGLLCGPYLLNVITSRMARDLQIVNEFALALIALVAGLELNVRKMRAHLRNVVVLGGSALFGTMVVLTAVLWMTWPLLPFGEISSASARFAAALITAALVTSFSPTVTIAVITESRSRGPFTDLVMAIVVVADLLLILVFAPALELARWTVAAAAPARVGVGVQLSWEIIGSLAFGAIIGAAFATYLRVVRREVTMALLAVCAALAIIAPLLRFELILAALAAGLVVENVAPPEGDELRLAIQRGALPVLVAFFAAAGASLQLDVLAAVGLLALLLAAVRLSLIRGICGLVLRRAPVADGQGVWMGLISQAGVTLGLATIVASEFPEWGGRVRTLIIALTGLHVLIGPILFRAALQRAGEIPRLSPSPDRAG